MADEPKRYLPAFLDLEARLVIVVGDTPASRRKIGHLLRYGADVTVIQPGDAAWLREQEGDGKLTLENRAYTSGDLRGATMGFCYEPDPDIRTAFKAEARRLGCPVNIAGEHDGSSFLIPGAVNRAPLQIAVSTGGMAPELAKHVRSKLAQEFGEHWGAYVEYFAEVRRLLFGAVDDEERRAELLASVIASDAEQRFAAGDGPTPEATVEGLLAPEPVEHGEE